MMNENDNEKLREFIPLKKEGIISQQDPDKFLASLKNKSTGWVNTTEAIDKKENYTLNSPFSLNENFFENVGTVVGNGVALSSSLLDPQQGIRQVVPLSMYRDFPTGFPYVHARGVPIYLSEQTRVMATYGIDYVMDLVRRYGQNSTIVTGKSLMKHFKDAYDLFPDGSKPILEEYLYLLYRVDQILPTSTSMDLGRLDAMKSTIMLDYIYNTEFNYDSFRQLARFMLGFMYPAQENIEAYLNALHSHYLTGNSEAIFAFMYQILQEFLNFINYLVVNKASLYIVDPRVTNLEIPCGLYVERGNFENSDTTQVYLYFEDLGRKYHFAYYNSYINMVDNITVVVPVMSMQIR